VEHLYLEVDTNPQSPQSRYEDIHHVISVLRDAGMDLYELQEFDQRDGKVIRLDEHQISRNRRAMVYGFKVK
jgi:hypothetical protein